MSKISDHIININSRNEKVLSIFLTAGFPEKRTFPQLAVDIIDAGADLLEIGIPFSDPLADGPIIQSSSQTVLVNGITLKEIFAFTSFIKSRRDIPVILMGYANPILRYGISNFLEEAMTAGADGLIVPDVPFEEYGSFYCDKTGLDIILLVTPTSTEERVRKIDHLSEGFVYCVSITGTTGVQGSFNAKTIDSIRNAYTTVTKNKMLLGFGISSEAGIRQVKDYCDGVIVGSAVVKKLSESNVDDTLQFINKMKTATC